MSMSGKPLPSAYRCSPGTAAWSGSSARSRWCRATTAGLDHPRGRLRRDRSRDGEAALQGERDLLTASLDTMGAVVVVLARDGAIIGGRGGEMLSAFVQEGAGTLLLGPVPHAREASVPGAPRRSSPRARTPASTRPTRSLAMAPAAASPGRARCCPGRGHAQPHHHRRHRRRGAQAHGEGAARDQRSRAAPDRAGPPRRAGPAPHRHRVHEQGARPSSWRRSARRGRPRPPRSCAW